jgi:transcriptional regulator with XRE-family HTH domain
MQSLRSATVDGAATLVANNLLRIMAEKGLNITQVAELTGIDKRTLLSIRRARGNTQSQTLHKLAVGLGVDPDELFGDVSPQYAFDRATNPVVADVVDDNPAVFKDWKRADFRELCSNRGYGGEMTDAGVLALAEAINRRREVMRKVEVIMASSHGPLFAAVVDAFYRRLTSIA